MTKGYVENANKQVMDILGRIELQMHREGIQSNWTDLLPRVATSINFLPEKNFGFPIACNHKSLCQCETLDQHLKWVSTPRFDAVAWKLEGYEDSISSDGPISSDDVIFSDDGTASVIAREESFVDKEDVPYQVGIPMHMVSPPQAAPAPSKAAPDLPKAALPKVAPPKAAPKKEPGSADTCVTADTVVPAVPVDAAKARLDADVSKTAEIESTCIRLK